MSPRRDLLALGHAHSQATFNRSTVARYPRSTFISIRRDEPTGARLGQLSAAAGPNALTHRNNPPPRMVARVPPRAVPLPAVPSHESVSGAASSKVIAVSNPIKVHAGGRVVLPRAAAPLDISIERIDQRRRAIEDQIPVPPQLNPTVLPSVEVGDVPGVGYNRAEVHYLGIRVHVTPEFVTAIDKCDGGRRGQRRGTGGQTQQIFFDSGTKGHKAKSRADRKVIQSQWSNVPLVRVRAGVDSQGLIRGPKFRIKKINDERCSICSSRLRGNPRRRGQAGTAKELDRRAARAHIQKRAAHDGLTDLNIARTQVRQIAHAPAANDRYGVVRGRYSVAAELAYTRAILIRAVPVKRYLQIHPDRSVGHWCVSF